MERDKTWLILPLIAFTKFESKGYEITVGWLNKTFSFIF
jgi:hypothetical protein